MTAVRPGTPHGRHRDASRPVRRRPRRIFGARPRPLVAALALVVVAAVVAALVFRVPALRPDTAASVPTRTAYYVSCDTGSDSAAGTSPGEAWRSLGNLSRAFSPSTAIYLARGCSWQGGIWLSGDGTADAPIVLDAYGAGEPPHVANPDGGASSSVLTLAGSYQIVQNLLITDGRAAAVKVEGAYAVVRNNEISSSGIGVETAESGTHARMLGNYVHDLHMVVNTPKSVHPDDDYGAVCFNIGSDDAEIAYNLGENCRAPSYDYGTDGGFVEAFGHGDNLYVHHNYALNTNGMIEVGGSPSSPGNHAYNVRISYNLMAFADSNGHAVLINHGAGNVYAMPASLSFDHNTYVNTHGPANGNNSALIAPTDGLAVRDNIFYSAINMDTLPAVHTGNLFYMARGATTYALGATEKVADPATAAPAGGTFRLADPGAVPWLRRALDHGKARDGVEALPSAPDAGALQ